MVSSKLLSALLIVSAHQAHKSFLKPSQLPGEYTAQLQPSWRIHVINQPAVP